MLSGGNVDPRLLASVIMRGLVRSGRLTRLHIEIPDVPGSLGRVTTVVGEAGANIVEIGHQRMFLDVSARSAELEVVIETFDHDHVERVVAALAEAGHDGHARRGDLRAGLSPAGSVEDGGPEAVDGGVVDAEVLAPGPRIEP